MYNICCCHTVLYISRQISISISVSVSTLLWSCLIRVPVHDLPNHTVLPIFTCYQSWSSDLHVNVACYLCDKNLPPLNLFNYIAFPFILISIRRFPFIAFQSPDFSYANVPHILLRPHKPNWHTVFPNQKRSHSLNRCFYPFIQYNFINLYLSYFTKVKLIHYIIFTK